MINNKDLVPGNKACIPLCYSLSKSIVVIRTLYIVVRAIRRINVVIHNMKNISPVCIDLLSGKY